VEGDHPLGDIGAVRRRVGESEPQHGDGGWSDREQRRSQQAALGTQASERLRRIGPNTGGAAPLMSRSGLLGDGVGQPRSEALKAGVAGERRWPVEEVAVGGHGHHRADFEQ
jgi:hypothetical protein